MDKGEILQVQQGAELGLLRRNVRARGKPATNPFGESGKYPHRKAHKNPERSKSVRSRLGDLLRETSRREDGQLPERKTDLALSLETTRRPLSALQPKDYKAHWMA